MLLPHGTGPGSLRRPTGHRLAGEWLERMGGEPDPLELATHFHLGQQPARALPFYLQAAKRFLERHDLPGLLRCQHGALACGYGGEAPSV